MNPGHALEYSVALRCAKEPLLYNFYQGHDLYRFTCLRSFDLPIIISIHRQGNRIWVQTKKLDRQPKTADEIVSPKSKVSFLPPNQPFGSDQGEPRASDTVIIRADHYAKIALNQTRVLSKTEWDHFERLLAQANFWKLVPTDTSGGLDGSLWLIEAHFSHQYGLVDRFAPDGNLRSCGDYLIKLSGLNERAY